MLSTTEHPVSEQMVEHWRWRPEWTAGRVCVWWYLTFENHPVLVELADEVGEQLGGCGTVDVVPSQWLHLSLGEVGFADELAHGELADVLSRAQAALQGVDPFALRVGPVATLPGAVVLEAHRGEGVEHLRDHLPRRRPGSVPSSVPWPGPEEVQAHISVAYVNTDCDREAVVGHLTGTVSPVSITVGTVVLAAVTRRERHYEWAPMETVPLATPHSGSTQTGVS